MAEYPHGCLKPTPSGTGKACHLLLGHTGDHRNGTIEWGRDQSDIELSKLRETVPGGAVRDPHPERKPANWFSVDLESVRAIAETHYEGDTRYGMGNWRKGLPASNLLNRAMEHLFLMLEGDTTEPHLEHCLWNLGKLRWMAKHKPELIDVPMVRKALGLEFKDYAYQKVETVMVDSPFDVERCSVRDGLRDDSPRCTLPTNHNGMHFSPSDKYFGPGVQS